MCPYCGEEDCIVVEYSDNFGDNGEGEWWWKYLCNSCQKYFYERRVYELIRTTYEKVEE